MTLFYRKAEQPKIYCFDCRVETIVPLVMHNNTRRHSRAITPKVVRYRRPRRQVNSSQDWYDQQWSYAEANGL